MSTPTLPRRSPRKNPQHSPSVAQPATQNAQTHWEATHERVLIDILMDWVVKGVKETFGQHLHEITDTLNSRIDGNTVYRKDQVGRKIRYLKTAYREYTDLISGSVTTGSGWDAESNTVALTAEQWIQLRDVRILAPFFVHTFDVSISHCL